MTPERLAKIQAVLGRRQPDLTVIADEVHKGRNLAAILRTCDAVGVDTVYSVLPSAGYRPYRGTALGSQKWVRVELCEALREPVSRLSQAGFQILTTAVEVDAVDFRSIDYTLPTALILGAELEGVSGYALAAAHKKIIIPMLGMVQSLNVSVACAMILAEAQRQRLAAGLYEQNRMSPALYKARLFQWAQPEVADYCDKKGLEYPELDAAGEIIDAPGWIKTLRGED